MAIPVSPRPSCSFWMTLSTAWPPEAQAFSTPVDEATIFGGALAGQDPVSPQPFRDAVLGFLIALVVVSELTVLAHFTGDRFSGNEDSAEVVVQSSSPAPVAVSITSGAFPAIHAVVPSGGALRVPLPPAAKLVLAGVATDQGIRVRSDDGTTPVEVLFQSPDTAGVPDGLLASSHDGYRPLPAGLLDLPQRSVQLISAITSA